MPPATGLSSPSALTRLADALHQRIAQQRFLDNGNLRFRRTGVHRGVGLADKEYRRRENLLFAQFCDQLHSSHARHSLVDDKTIANAVAAVEKLRSIAISLDRKSFQLQSEFQRASDGRIVVDNYNRRRRRRRRHLRLFYRYCLHPATSRSAPKFAAGCMRPLRRLRIDVPQSCGGRYLRD